MTFSRSLLWTGLALIATMLAAACTGEVVREVPVERVVEKPVIKEVIKEVSVEKVVERPVIREVEKVVVKEVAMKPRSWALFAKFDDFREGWERKAKEGPLKITYSSKVIETFDASGQPAYKPKSGDMLVYINTGDSNWGILGPNEKNENKYNRITIIDAKTKKILATNEIPQQAGSSHQTVLSPDGRYVYIGGGYKDRKGVITKVDSLTLKPVKQIDIGSQLHHGQIFQGRYILMDTFRTMKEEAADVFLFDPETDRIIGGIKAKDLGGRPYIAFAGPGHEHIYILMEPPPTGEHGQGFYAGSGAIPENYWVAVVDPNTWEVVREYPYPGWRSDWIEFSKDGRFMYVDSYMDDSVMKISLETGGLVWKAPVGVGPYGIELSANEKEVWVTDKGEGKDHKGRTISIVDSEKGTFVDTIAYGGRGVDHLVLSPDGKEIWATANDSGSIFVMDVTSHKTREEIVMPLRGDPHGLVFVQYDSSVKGRVVADQGGFPGSINPRGGTLLQASAPSTASISGASPIAPPSAMLSPASPSSLSGDVVRGEVIFQKTAGGSGCSLCHGKDAQGISAPRIVDKETEDIKFALSSVPAMRFININSQEIADVAAYLKSLKAGSKL